MRRGSMVRTNVGRDEAMSMLREWKRRRTLLRIALTGERVATACLGRIVDLTDDRITTTSDDSTAEVEFALLNDLSFGIGDSDEGFEEDGVLYGRFLTCFIPVRHNPHSPETLSFVEVTGVN